MQGKDEIEAQARFTLFNKAISAIEKQINDKFKSNQELLRLLAELKQNSELIESIFDTSKDNEQLSHLADTGKEIYEELEQKIKLQDRNIAALLKSEFNKIKIYYLAYLSKEQENSMATSGNSSQSMNYLTAGGNIIAKQKNQNYLPRSPAEKLPEMWNVPQRNKFFTGRNELLKQMAEYFNTKESKHLVLTAHGLGGIGKTQLTLEYIWQHYKEYQGVCWFNAENKDRLITSYINLGQELHIFDDSNKNILIDEKAKIVKTWLENKAPTGWLLIFDNPIKYEDIAQLLPVKGGHILITSRYTEWPGQCFAVTVFTLQEAREYAEKIIGSEKVKAEAESLEKLIDTLGRLPLALAQAFAYIKKNNKTIGQYFSLYESSKAELLAKNLLPTGDEHEPVSITWNVTLKRMQEECPASVELLYCCTHLHYEAIPVQLVKYLLENTNALQIDDAQRIAKEYSMITVDEQNKTFSIHSLVQQVIVEQLRREDNGLNYLFKGIRGLNNIYPYNQDQMLDLMLKKQLNSHLVKALIYLEQYIGIFILINIKLSSALDIRWQINILLEVLICLADSYAVLGNVHKNKALLERCLSISESLYGKEHTKIGKILGNLANAYGDLGNAHEQKILLEKALKIFRLHCSDNHIEIAKTLMNLGIAYGTLGDAHRKKELCKKALFMNEKYYGKNHIFASIILTNLAIAYGTLGDVRKHKELLEQALLIKELHYGKDHLEVAGVLMNLGIAYSELGDFHRSKELLERALLIKEAFYGKNYVEIALILTNLGNTYGQLGNQHKRKELLERALLIKEAFYGKRHIEVAITLGNLATTYGILGDAHKQKELLERTLAIKEEYYGKNHVEVAKVKINLASAYGMLGDTSNEKKLLEQILPMLEQNYGKNNVTVSVVISNLAGAYNTLGDGRKSKKLLKKALMILEAHYGKDHVEVARAIVNLAQIYGDLGDAHKQKELLERILPILELNYGKDHPDVANALVGLGNAYGSLGNVLKQKELLERALNISESFYENKNHIDIANILFNLANTYGKLGDFFKMKFLLERVLKIEENFYGRKHIKVVKTLNSLGCAYGALGDAHMKRRLLEETLKILELNYDEEHPYLAIPLINLGMSYLYQSVTEAKLYVQRSYDIFLKSQNYGVNHPYTQKAKQILDEINQKLPISQKEKDSSDTLFKSVFNKTLANTINYQLDKIIKKYNLSDSSQLSLEKGLRMAVINNQIEDLDILTKVGVNINAQDNNPQSRQTALHLAVLKQAKPCIRKMLEAGAKFNITDASGKTAFNYAREINDIATLRLFAYQLIYSSQYNWPFFSKMSSNSPTKGSSAKNTINELITKTLIENKQTILQLLLQEAKIIIDENQKKGLVQIIFTDYKLVQQFTEELYKIGIHNLAMKNVPLKPNVIIGEDSKEDEYIILLSFDEYNTVMDDKDAYVKLVNSQSQTFYDPKLFVNKKYDIGLELDILKSDVLKSLLAQAKISLYPGSNKQLVQILFSDRILIQKFVNELHKINFSGHTDDSKNKRHSIYVKFEGVDKHDDAYFVLLTDYEYNKIVGNKEAYINLVKENLEGLDEEISNLKRENIVISESIRRIMP